jgi:2-dehydropantoate 2-reductase
MCVSTEMGGALDVLIIGAGAIGSWLAHRLGNAGHRVTAVGRAPYVEAIHQRGLLVEEDGRAVRATGLTAVGRVDALEGDRFDLVLITTKAFDTAVAAVLVRPFVERGALAIVIQNGFGGIEIARGILGERYLYGGVKPAVIRPRSKRGGLTLSPIIAGQSVTFLVQMFAQAGLKARSCADWRAIKWSKLMLNLIANAIPAILDWPLERVYAHRALYEVERDALCEARAIGHRMGLRLVSLPGYPVPALVWAMCTLPPVIAHPVFQRAIVDGRGGKRPSLHIDLSQGRRRSEVDFLNGAVVQAGERLGIPTPVNRALYETLSGIVRGEIGWHVYQGQVDRLLDRIRGQDENAAPASQ